MRVCYFGTYRRHYARNRIMIDGLRANDVDVVECNVPLWTGIEDRVDKASGGWLNLHFFRRVVRAYWQLLRQYRTVGDYNVLMLGYPGYFDAFVARPMAWLARKPLVLDTLMSLYLVADDRGLVQKSPFTSRLVRIAEKMACWMADMLILDTPEYVEYFHRLHGLERERFRLVPIGVDDRIYRPFLATRSKDDQFRLIYYGTFIQNHGTLNIVEAARILSDQPHIHFTLVGQGPDRPAAVALTQKYGLSNIDFVDWVDKTELPRLVAQADVCLGVFGTTTQSMITVHNKIKEGMAMAKPVITGDSPTVRAALTHGEHVWLCRRDDPQSLAESAIRLYRDPDLCKRLSRNGERLIQERYTLQETGRQTKSYLMELLDQRN